MSDGQPAPGAEAGSVRGSLTTSRGRQISELRENTLLETRTGVLFLFVFLTCTSCFLYQTVMEEGVTIWTDISATERCMFFFLASSNIYTILNAIFTLFCFSSNLL